jgi:hypothetical protein
VKKQSGHNEFSFLKSAYQDWENSGPSDSLWERMDESLAVEKVWNAVDEELESLGSSKDQWIKDAHATWNPATNFNAWDQLTDELSREVVWQQLAQSLEMPVAPSMPWLKMVAATIALVMCTFYIADVGSDCFHLGLNPSTAKRSASYDRSMSAKNVQVQATNPIVESKSIQAELIESEGTDNLPQLPVVSDEGGQLQALTTIEPNFVTTHFTRFEPVEQPRAFHPTWTLQLGSQWSAIGENNRPAFTTSVPKLGIAVDLAYSKTIRHFRFTQSIGFSQYAQNNGRYVNGRYLNTDQRLNTLQLSSTIGYNWNRFHVFSGVMVSRLMGGMEENNFQVTNVYTVSQLKLGITGGLDYRIKNFENGCMLSAGAQYQWIPTIESSNVTFENIQGIKIQAKISF